MTSKEFDKAGWKLDKMWNKIYYAVVIKGESLP